MTDLELLNELHKVNTKQGFNDSERHTQMNKLDELFPKEKEEVKFDTEIALGGSFLVYIDDIIVLSISTDGSLYRYSLNSAEAEYLESKGIKVNETSIGYRIKDITLE